MTTLRPEDPGDAAAIRAVHEASFPTSAEAQLVDLLRAAGHLSVSLVAVRGKTIVGHVAFSPVTTATGAVGVGLAPVAVLERHRRGGIAARLIEAGLAACRDAHFRWAVVLGEPEYYSRFGFLPAQGFGLSDEYGGGPAFQALELTPGGLPIGAGLVRYAPEFSGLGGESEASAARPAGRGAAAPVERASALVLDDTTRVEICPATTPEQIAAIRTLFQEYAAWLRIDLCFQGFAEELAALPGIYAPPRGRLLLATGTGGPAGCVALRPAGDTVCEMKRLFVRAAHQGHGLGRTLAREAISSAKGIGYRTMVLDTLPFMQNAIRLYESLGFVRRPAYYDTPLPETIFMELHLSE